MKKVKILGVVLLLAASITTFTLLNAVTVTISSKGQASAEQRPDGSVKYWCDPITQSDCTITIEMKPPVG